ncbi:MAG TPA: PAS domain S-box protein [Gemmatimonadales bacterium]
MSDPTESPRPAGDESASPAAAAGRRPRLSRPTPSHLFAERSDGEGNGRRRATRVIPELAGAPEDPPPPATAAVQAKGPDRPEPVAGVRESRAAPVVAYEPDGAAAHAPEYPPDVVFIVRVGGVILYVNRPLGRRSEEEVVGSQFTDWVFPDQHAAVRDAVGRVFATGRADGVELQGIQGHDPDSWFECRIAPNTREGKVVSVTIIARDVTRYKQTEKALVERTGILERELDDRRADLDLLRAQSAAADGGTRADTETLRFRAAIETAGEAVFLVDPDGEVLVDLNDTACRWLRRHRAELRGQPVAGLGLGFPLVPPASFDVGFTETRDNRRPLILEGAHARKDGSTFPVEVSVIAHAYEGHDYLLAVARDVKDRRRAQDAIAEAEAQYRALFEQSFDAIYLTTRGGAIVDANSAALALFGYRREEFLGLDARTIMPDVNDIRRFQRMMAAERFVARLDVSLQRRHGGAFAAVLSASRRRDAQDRLLGYQWVVRTAGDPAARASDPAIALDPAQAAVAEPDAGWDAPRPSGDERSGGIVLLVGGREAVLREGAQALERAGFAVFQAQDGAGAIKLLRTDAAVVHAAVIRGQGEAHAEDVARDLRALTHDLRVVLVRPANADLVPPPDLAAAAVLRDPAHPLALVQAVREVLGQAVA